MATHPGQDPNPYNEDSQHSHLCRVAVKIRGKAHNNSSQVSGISEGPGEESCHQSPALMGCSFPRHCFPKKPNVAQPGTAPELSKLPELPFTWLCSLDHPDHRAHQPLGTEEASREGCAERVHALEVHGIRSDSGLS